MTKARRAAAVAWVVAGAAAPACSLVTEFPADRLPPTSEQDCADGLDEDRDGDGDCADTDCIGDPACAEDSAEECGDGVDNDRDGRADCDDEGCHGWGVCLHLAPLVATPPCHRPMLYSVGAPWHPDTAWVLVGDQPPVVGDNQVEFPADSWVFDRLISFRPLVFGAGQGLLVQFRLTVDDLRLDRDFGFHAALATGTVEDPALPQEIIAGIDIERGGQPSLDTRAVVTASLHGEPFESVDGEPAVAALDAPWIELSIWPEPDGWLVLKVDGVTRARSRRTLAPWEPPAHAVFWSDPGNAVRMTHVTIGIRPNREVDEWCVERRNPVIEAFGFIERGLRPAVVRTQHQYVALIAVEAASAVERGRWLETWVSDTGWLWTPVSPELHEHVVGPHALHHEPADDTLMAWFEDDEGSWRITAPAATPGLWSEPAAVQGPSPSAVAGDEAGGLLGWHVPAGGGPIRLLRSEDAGLSWQDEGPALHAGDTGDWDAGGLLAPSVASVGGGYVMVYEGRDAVTDSSAAGIAVSRDGRTWRKRDSPVVEPSPGGFDEGSIKGPSILVDEAEGVVRIWYQGRPKIPDAGFDRIGIAELLFGDAVDSAP